MYEVVMSRSSPSLSRRNRPLMATARRWRAPAVRGLSWMPRSIYNLWSQVLEYFDASIIELPAKPGGPPMPCSTRTWWVRLPRWRQCATGWTCRSGWFRSTPQWAS